MQNCICIWRRVPLNIRQDINIGQTIQPKNIYTLGRQLIYVHRSNVVDEWGPPTSQRCIGGGTLHTRNNGLGPMPEGKTLSTRDIERWERSWVRIRALSNPRTSATRSFFEFSFLFFIISRPYTDRRKILGSLFQFPFLNFLSPSSRSHTVKHE